MGKKSLVLGVCALMLVLVVFSSGCIDFGGEEKKETTPGQQEGGQYPGTWHYVITITGDNTKTTDSFYCSGTKQKVEWSYQGRSEYGSWMYWYFYEEETGDLVGTGGSTSYEGYASDSGEDFVYCGSGYYYLGISESQATYEIKVYTYY